MKIFVLLAVFLVYVATITIAQTLPTPTFSYVPCYGLVGTTDSVVVNPVPGATGYIWDTNPLQISGVLFNGLISPVETATPSTNITYVLAQQFYEVCVTAFSVCCTSAQVCDTISGINQIQFNPSNSSIALPNTIDLYGINFVCPAGGTPVLINWFVTGDITFSNGTQTLTGTNTLNVPLTFGPGFISGTLCAFTTIAFGINSDTICLTINAPVGVAETNTPQLNFYLENQNEQLVIELPLSSISKTIKIHDALGRLVSETKAIPATQNATIKINVSTYSEGLYIISLFEDKKIHTGKFLITR